MGLVRRDFGAAGLTELTLTHMQTLVSLVVITLFVPCIASVMMILKERTRLEGLWIWGGSIVIAFVTGGVLYQMSKYLGGNQETTMAFVIIVAAVLAWLGIKWFTKIRGAKHVA